MVQSSSHQKSKQIVKLSFRFFSIKKRQKTFQSPTKHLNSQTSDVFLFDQLFNLCFVAVESLIFFMFCRPYLKHAVGQMINCLGSREKSAVTGTQSHQLRLCSPVFFPFTISVFVNLGIECLHCKKENMLLTGVQTCIELSFQSQPCSQPSVSNQYLKQEE